MYTWICIVHCHTASHGRTWESSSALTSFVSLSRARRLSHERKSPRVHSRVLACLIWRTHKPPTKILTETKINSQAQLISLKRSGPMNWDQIKRPTNLLNSYRFCRFFVCQLFLKALYFFVVKTKRIDCLPHLHFAWARGSLSAQRPWTKTAKFQEQTGEIQVIFRIQTWRESWVKSYIMMLLCLVGGLVAKCVLLSFNLRHCGSRSGSEISQTCSSRVGEDCFFFFETLLMN